ncbi:MULTISPECIES: hypothetical protein [unclassified Sporosarcina]|uniref:hypothetical protein n=1 Tax=unclassified Sporosarcina TaxID=2647733 RepID=UPI001A92E07B|nr:MULTISPECIES: hypothetical protein [unclassified Sporosarcina]MBO0588393.1 hypothetical protein [Sporosarcina sp. E16_8]MBO0601903.1 hypothetical protein [Sporosarcina sp. E16_3]
MRKGVLILLLFFFLIPSTSVFAEVNTSDNNSCSPVMSDEKKDSVKKFLDKDASLQESYAINIIETFWNAVGINTLDTLVFGNPYCIWFDNEPELIFGMFPAEQKETMIDPIFSLFTGLYMLALIIAIMISSLKVAYEPLGTNKTEFREDVYMYIGTSVLLAGFWLLAEQIFSINWGIVSAFRSMLTAQGISLGEPLIVAAQDDFNFTDIIIMLAEWFIVLFLNFVYMMRTFMITILLGLGGLAILSLLFTSSRSYFVTWIQDFLGAIFMQSVHAIYLSVVLLFVSTLNGEAAIFFKLLLLIMFIPMSTMVMGWLNLSSGTVSTTLGMQGVNSIASAARMARMGKGKMGNNKLPNSKVPDYANLKKTQLSTTANGANSNAWVFAKSVFSKSGMVIGAAAGSVLGPGGIMLGAGMGGTAASGLLQGSRNLAGGVKGITDTMKLAKTDGMKNTLGNLQSRRAFFGNLGESTGSMVGIGEFGRSVGHGLSGVSRQRLFHSDEAGGFAGKTFADVAKEHPGAKVSWMQTNAGSGFYMEDNGKMRAISPLGAADPTLAKGETRMMDYQFNQMGYQPDANQQYSLSGGGIEPMTRLSDPYIKGAGGHSIQDPRMKANEMSPDSYFKNSMANTESRGLSDRVADRVARHQGFV